MKNMKKINMIAAVFLITAFLTTFANEALAKPNWVSTKVRSWSIREAPPSYELYVEITHTNNSEERVVTNIYDKAGRFTLKKPFTYKGKKTTAFTVLALKSTKNSAVELTPGESHTLAYIMKITQVDNGLKGVGWSSEEARQLIASGGWKLSYTYDCSVKSRPERQERGRRGRR